MIYCNRCKQNKAEAFFRRDSQGYISWCIECSAKYKNIYRKKCPNLSTAQSERWLNKIKNTEGERYEQYKRYHREHSLKYNKLYPKRYAVKKIVIKALKDGKIIRSSQCQICKCSKNIHAHHCDYNKPLDIMWLCAKHHKKWHTLFIPNE